MSASRSWKIERKMHRWTVKPEPGPHSKNAIPLLLLVRDILHLADNSGEVKRILNESNVRVDGRVRRDHKFPIGMFDVISIPLIGKYFIALPDKEERISFKEIKEEESRTKLCKVKDKTTVKGGKIQLNLHDGKNILLDQFTNEKDVKTGDSILVSLPTSKGERIKIVDRFLYAEGSRAIVGAGKHMGEIGEIKEKKKIRGPSSNMVVLQREDGTEFETVEDYVFVID